MQEEAAPPMDRRASVANSGPEEYRSLMRKLREQHPELGPFTEEVSLFSTLLPLLNTLFYIVGSVTTLLYHESMTAISSSKK